MEDPGMNDPSFEAVCNDLQNAVGDLGAKQDASFTFTTEVGNPDPDQSDEQSDVESLLSFAGDEDVQTLFGKYGPPYDVDILKDSATVDGLPTDDGSLKKIVVRPGVGACVKMGNNVSIRYRAFVDLGDEPFDVRFSKKLRTFEVGGTAVLIGLDLSMLSMKRKELSLFIIAPDMAFGEAGCAPIGVPPNAVLIFEVELVGISGVPYEERPDERKVGKKAARPNECAEENQGSDETSETHELTFDERIDDIRKLAYGFRKLKRRDKVINMWRRGREMLDKCSMTNELEENEWEKAYDLFCYRACLRLKKVGEPRLVARICREALQRFPDEPKYLYKWGTAIKAMASKPEDFQAARKKFMKALEGSILPEHRRPIFEQLELLDEIEKTWTPDGAQQIPLSDSSSD